MKKTFKKKNVETIFKKVNKKNKKIKNKKNIRQISRKVIEGDE